MKRELRSLLLMISVSFGFSVIMDSKDHPGLDDESVSFGEAFGVCISKKEHGTVECVNRGALSALQSLNEKDDLDFGDVRLERAGGYGRELLDLDYDPSNFGNVVQAAARLMERRNMKWNMDNVYPGLQMRVGPMLNGNGVLEFVLNERSATYSDRQGGAAGRTLTRHLLLPFLLGFKFNLASLIPLIFGVLLVISKKALLLTKFALLLSGVLGWSSLFSGGPGIHHAGNHGFNHFGPGFDGSTGGHHHEYFPHRPFRANSGLDFGQQYGQHVIREVVNVYETDGEQDARQDARRCSPFVSMKFMSLCNFPQKFSHKKVISLSLGVNNSHLGDLLRPHCATLLHVHCQFQAPLSRLCMQMTRSQLFSLPGN
ncbi:uncharacterized protein Osi10a [Prorops nasuta]|uniref:uncharacterized protein Osi10a n=1 Tax=Prorops nasuta TaxID=863751 RepID=UPI0034CEF0A8